MTDLEQALKDYVIDTEPGVKIPKVKFNSDAESFTAIGYNFGDGSAGFDTYNEEGKLTASVQIDAKSARKFLKFIEGILK
jgi:hypothetical protein